MKSTSLLFLTFLSLTSPGCSEEPAAPATPSAAESAEWIVSDWKDWKQQDTGPDAKVEVVKELAETSPGKVEHPAPTGPAAEAGILILRRGNPFTAVKYEGARELPLTDYEISWEAMRLDGSDFFSALTFPVGAKDKCASLVNGAWGGYVVGVSSIGHMFANENQTTSSMEFTTGRWYSFALQVNTECLRCLIDGKEMFKADIRGMAISMHPSEIQKCAPLGFSAYDTAGAIRNVRIRKLKPGTLKPDEYP